MDSNTFHHQAPGGSWRDTARNINIADGRLTAELRKADGSWVHIEVPIDELAPAGAEYENIDGALVPTVGTLAELEQMEAELESIASQLQDADADEDEDEAQPEPEPQPSPTDLSHTVPDKCYLFPGSWQATARNVAITEDLLTAELQKSDGSWVPAQVQYTDGSPFTNVDGFFVPSARGEDEDEDEDEDGSSRFPPVEYHAEMTQLPGMRLSTSDVQGHDVDEAEALERAIQNSLDDMQQQQQQQQQQPAVVAELVSDHVEATEDTGKTHAAQPASEPQQDKNDAADNFEEKQPYAEPEADDNSARALADIVALRRLLFAAVLRYKHRHRHHCHHKHRHRHHCHHRRRHHHRRHDYAHRHNHHHQRRCATDQQLPAVPRGSWRDTARNINIADGRLKAELRKADGSWVHIEVPIDELAPAGAECENIDGELVACACSVEEGVGKDQADCGGCTLSHYRRRRRCGGHHCGRRRHNMHNHMHHMHHMHGLHPRPMMTQPRHSPMCF
jgi:hypothetical protein